MATKASRIRENVINALNQEASQPTPRQKILDEASELTHSSRNSMYGNPEDNFRNIADLWNTFLGASNRQAMLTVNDVAMFMILMKTARLATNPNHHDSCVDIAGYAACLGDIQAAATPYLGDAEVGVPKISEDVIKQSQYNHANAMKGSLRR